MTMRQGRRWARVRAAAAVATAVMGVSSAARPASAAQGGKNPRRPAEESRVRMILQVAQRSEARIQSGRVELRKLTEISPAGERWLREHLEPAQEVPLRP